MAIGLAALGVILSSIVVTADDPAGRDRDAGRQLFGTWSASPQLAGAFPVPSASGFSNQTIRDIVHTSIGGRAVRLRLSNAFGMAPLTFDAVSIGIQASGASLEPGSKRVVTFGGHQSVTVAPGAESLSDRVALDSAPSSPSATRSPTDSTRRWTPIIAGPTSWLIACCATEATTSCR